MSVKVMGRIWELELPYNHLLVLLALADHADHDGGSIYPGIGLVAWKTGYTERNVQRVMRELEASGVLVKVEDRPGFVPEYRIDFSAATPKTPYKKPINQPPASARQGRQIVTPPPDKLSPLPPDKLSPVKPAGGVTNLHRGGDNLSQGGEISNTTLSQIGLADAAQSPPTVMEPSWNRHGVEDTSADVPPAPPAGEKKRRRTPDPNQAHRACQVFADLSGKKPNAVQASAIVSAIPDTEAGLATWSRVVADWLGRGWASGNVSGMLDRYRKESSRGQPRAPRSDVPAAPKGRLRSVFDPPGPAADGQPAAVPDVRRADRAARDGGDLAGPPPQVLDGLPLSARGHRRE